MTNTEFIEKQKPLLGRLPPEFRGVVSFQSWQTGHSSGYEEVLLHLQDLVEMLETPIKNFEHRIRQSIPNPID
jgi:hypothetical protein